MPMNELAPPTLIEVAKAIHAMEKKYFSTQTFIDDAERANEVLDDEAQEWRYLLMQRQAMLRELKYRSYACNAGPKDYSLEDELQAQIQVAA